MGKGRGVYRVLVRKSEGKRPLERPRRRWKNNINTLYTKLVIWEEKIFLHILSNGINLISHK
jgi:hypothetical protein